MLISFGLFFLLYYFNMMFLKCYTGIYYIKHLISIIAMDIVLLWPYLNTIKIG